MRAATNLRRVLLATVFSMAAVACADTEIASPGTAAPVAPPPTTAPPAGPTVTTVEVVTQAQVDAFNTANGFAATDPQRLILATVSIDATTEATVARFNNLGAGGQLPDGLTIPADLPLLIKGVTTVGADEGATGTGTTLTLEPGAIIVGQDGPDVLVVNRGSQILANGTAADPIIFTSLADLIASTSPDIADRDGSENIRGEWGGLVINGQAPINDCDAGFFPATGATDASGNPIATSAQASCFKNGEGSVGLFGGADAADSSGVLRYVQVRYAGFRFTPENEYNGIAFQGVGNGVSTEAAAILPAGAVPFEYIQVHNNGDDGVEFFGGTANARYIVLTNNGDDSLDWTDGWQGNLQFVLIKQGNEEADNGIEADNRGGDRDAAPRSFPTVANLTFVGDAGLTSGSALRLREGTGGLIANSIFVKPGASCLRVDTEQDDAAVAGVDTVGTNTLNLESVLIDCPTPTRGDATPPVEADALLGNLSPFFVDTTSASLYNSDDELVTLGAAINTNVSAASSLTQLYFPGPTEFAVAPLDLTTSGNGFDNRSSGGIPGANGFDPALMSPGFSSAFFTQTDYIGAFGPDDRPGDNWTTGWTFGVEEAPATGSGACPTNTITVAGETIADASGATKSICRLQGTLTSDTTLTSEFVYQLNGIVYVGEDRAEASAGGQGASAAQAVLTIEAGTTIYGVNGPDVLVVNRGSQVIANGTEAAPIVFTSDEDLTGANTTGGERGQVGGLVINGFAPINDCDSGFGSHTDDASGNPIASTDQANCIKNGEGNSGFYGGNLAGDSSGVLRYVQVRFAGFRFNPQNELNGIAFQGVGNGVSTEAAAVLAAGEQPFEFIQVHNNADDGVEFFGGTANARYMVLTGNGDDSLDWTDGWTGNVQYLVVEQGNGDGDNIFEGDNRSGDRDAEPRSNPTIANATLIGRPSGGSVRLREGTAGTFANFIIRDFGGAALRLDAEQDGGAGGSGVDLITDDTGPTRLFSTFIDTIQAFRGDSGSVAEATALFATDADNVRRSGADNTNATVAGSLAGFNFMNSTTAGLTPTAAGAEAGVAATDASTFDSFFEATTYIGAVEPGTAEADLWFKDWTFESSLNARN